MQRIGQSAVSAICGLALSLVAWPLWAEEAAPPSVASGTQLMSVVFSLLVVLAVILALAWLLRRFGQGGFSGQGDMKIVASLSLGTRERLLVVDVQGQQLLIGVTPQQIRTLHVFDEPVIDPSQPRSADFKNKLMAIMQSRQSGRQ